MVQAVGRDLSPPPLRMVVFLVWSTVRSWSPSTTTVLLRSLSTTAVVCWLRCGVGSASFLFLSQHRKAPAPKDEKKRLAKEGKLARFNPDQQLTVAERQQVLKKA